MFPRFVRNDRSRLPRTAARLLPLLALLVMVRPGTAAAALTVEFPGPVPLNVLEDALCGQAVPWDDAADRLIVGTAAGWLRFVELQSTGELITRDRVWIGGELVALAAVPADAGGVERLLVAARNPDRLVTVRLSRSEPRLAVLAEVDLPEDPGAMVLLAADEVAIALPGIDRIALAGEVDGTWNLLPGLDSGDRPVDLAAADLDGDGTAELVAANAGALSLSLSVFRREASGLVLSQDLALPEEPRALAALDTDGDGVAEIAVVNGETALVRHYVPAAGLLAPAGETDLTVPADGIHAAAQAGGDWSLYVSSSARGLVEHFLRDGAGWSRANSYYPGCRPLGTTTGDFNGDHEPDLVSMGGSSHLITVMFGDGTSGFWGFPALALTASPDGVALADFDSDGSLDVVVLAADLRLASLFRGRAGGGVATEPQNQSLGFQPGPLTQVQTDGDPAPELAIYDRTSASLRLMEFVEGSGFQTAHSQTVFGNPQVLRAADVDADGHTDLIFVTQSVPEIRVLFGAGDGTFPDERTFGFDVTAVNVQPVDLTGDGHLDLVATDGQSRVWIALNEGGRHFRAESWVNAAAGANGLACGDLDNDLDDDVVVGNLSGENLSFFENTGDGNLVRRVGALALPGRPEDLDLADVNVDGILDVVVNTRTAGVISIVYGVAGWTYTPPATFAGGTDVARFATADFNGDLVPDLLTLDASLRLGLTMLNVERQIVAVARGALEVRCRGGLLRAEVRPDRSGDWKLEYGRPGAWSLAASAAGARAGELGYDGEAWIWEIAPEHLVARFGPAPGAGLLRLTVGVGGRAESVDVALDGVCGGAGGLPAAQPLAWSREPWPNPFNPLVHARIVLADRARVEAAVFDLRGRLVATLLAEEREAGEHLLRWDGTAAGRPAEAGLYVLRVSTPAAVVARKVMLLK